MLNIAIAVFIGGGLGSVLRWLISYRLNSLFPILQRGPWSLTVLVPLLSPLALLGLVKLPILTLFGKSCLLQVFVVA